MNGQLAGLPATGLSKNSVGLGLRSSHIDQILQQRPEVPWFEVLMENHTARGGLIADQLAAVREHYPISLHCLGMSIGGVDPLNMDYLATLKWMIKQYQPVQVSDHLCFTRYGKHQFNDLLPIPLTTESFQHIGSRIKQIQDYLGIRILIENVSSYLQFEASEMNEAEFLSELVSETGCGILLDINNAYVNEFNHGYSAKAFIDTLPIDSVGEVHLAGYEDKSDYLIDAHNNRVTDPVWALFEYYLQYAKGAPVLIEWDNDIPEFSVLLDEAEKAERIISRTSESRFPGSVRTDVPGKCATC
ncbi:MAG: DUF692 domain-containing protein [Proteobacteria bacterium]|nr:DUF692 domain-containing protein [Pseudomonadota bacterium]